jgi:hypothetical protein
MVVLLDNQSLSTLHAFVTYPIFRLTLFCITLTDDKKLGGVLKKIGLTDMKGLEEVNIFKDDGSVIHITNPKGIYQSHRRSAY